MEEEGPVEGAQHVQHCLSLPTLCWGCPPPPQAVSSRPRRRPPSWRGSARRRRTRRSGGRRPSWRRRWVCVWGGGACARPCRSRPTCAVPVFGVCQRCTCGWGWHLTILTLPPPLPRTHALQESGPKTPSSQGDQQDVHQLAASLKRKAGATPSRGSGGGEGAAGSGAAAFMTPEARSAGLAGPSGSGGGEGGKRSSSKKKRQEGEGGEAGGSGGKEWGHEVDGRTSAKRQRKSREGQDTGQRPQSQERRKKGGA